MPEVWITGVGAVSAVGSGYDAHAQALQAAASGLSRQVLFAGVEPDPCICGMVPRDIISLSIDDSAHDRADMLLEHALSQAMDDAGLRPGTRADIIAGTTLGNMHGATRYYRDIRNGQQPDMSLIAHFLPYAPVDAVARKLDISGHYMTLCSACASASAALGQAFRRIASGQSTCVLAGGFDALSPFVVAGFNSLRLVSSQLCKPFSRDRSGLNPGEGAAILVLESSESAQKRGARPRAKMAGFGEALEAYHYTRADPAGSGIATAFHKALECGGLDSGAIDHIHTHGTATEANDSSEYAAYSRIFGPRLKAIPACSTKPLTGHTFGAAGALNAVFCVASLAKQKIPATLNCGPVDPLFADLAIAEKPVDCARLSNAASATLGFGGEASVCIFAKASDNHAE